MKEYLKITNEDNMELMARYPDNHFDLAIVDPPYGLDMDNQKVRVKPNRNTYKRAGITVSKRDGIVKYQLKSILMNLFRVSKNQIIWGANYFCSYIQNG